MTQEEKAKAYDEASKWMENVYPTLSHEQQMEAEVFFPMFKESDDERIRKEIISAIKEDWPGHTDWIAWLEKQGEQKPVEWSKEDLSMIGEIRSIIEKYAFSQSAVDVNGELCEKEFIDADNWLKSLRPQNTWKPTEEQMKVLEYSTRLFSDTERGNYYSGVLKDLYQDLKKL